MPTCVALLRGVNVGGAKRVPMADLRALLAGLGHADVATLLNSGNAVFRARRGTPAAHAKDIASAILDRIGVEVPVIVKTLDELATIVAENPLAQDPPDPARLLVAFAADGTSLATLGSIAPLVTPHEQFAIGRHAAYLHCAGGILTSRAGEALLGKAGRLATTRNWATTLKLLALARRIDADDGTKVRPA